MAQASVRLSVKDIFWKTFAPINATIYIDLLISRLFYELACL